MNPVIVIAGAGRIGTHLGKRLKLKGLPIAQVFNRSEKPAQVLATALGCGWTTDPASILPNADWILLAVRDDAIESVADSLCLFTPNTLVTHTSGATPGSVLAAHCPRYGVFYPLQSFSLNRQPVWSKIPFCVDASTGEDLLFLRRIAKQIGNLVYQVDDEQRANLHVAAVFANNFANHCFAIAEQLLDRAELPFEMLHPLMEETLAKALADSPRKMQTGPAIRGDQDTIQRHLERLKSSEGSVEEIYRHLSASIQQYAADGIKNERGEADEAHT